MKNLVAFCFFMGFAQCCLAQKAYKDTAITHSFFKRESGMVAADGGYTVPLADGRVMWLFGDSYIDDYDPATHSVPCLFGANNVF